MPEVTIAYPTGAPCWVDLMAKDQLAALDFYCDLFGWQGQAGLAESGGYAVCELGGKAVAGIAPAPPPASATEGASAQRAMWISYLATADAEATQDAITAAGGTLLIPVMDGGALGRMLLARDPQGAVFGVWQPGEFSGAQVVDESGALVWNELHTDDVHAATRFYQEVFGTGVERTPGTDSRWALQAGGRTVGGVTLLADAPPDTPAHWLTYFAVDDVDSTVDALVKRDGTVRTAPFDTAAGRMSVVRDPQGALLALLKPPTP
ncbi:VOC family protein [Streptomyces sp. NPDC048665]|uniref:VOC family protein n=1 Tax=unclassified Streptomyces TaxID=2593676 RepID=UPI0034426282